MVRLPRHPSPLVARAHLLGRLDAAATVPLALALPPRDPAGEADLLRRLYDPQDPLFHQFLTPDEFTARFGPTEDDYAAVADYAQAHGLTVTGTHPNRLLLDVAGPAQAVEAAFGVRLHQYQAADGRVFHAPDAAPAVPAAVAARLAGVIGLDTSAVRHPHLRRLDPNARPQAIPVMPILGSGPGSGPGGGLTPSDVKTAYGFNGVNLDGQGQTLAVFELDGYSESDIRTYEDAFGLPHIPLETVPVDLNGTPLSPGQNADEAVLDIELAGALAPRADKIIAYEGPDTNVGIMDMYTRIATDDRAKQVSTCWGMDEDHTDPTVRTQENAIFEEMAGQGQTIYSASGDAGAYDDVTSPTTLSVDDPASQPYVTGVGGTTLSTHGVSGTWAGETTWNAGSIAGGAGGGGISNVWKITDASPAYQQGVISGASHGSTTWRNVPDVSLDSDPNVGYAIYYAAGGGWVVYGGTSTAAPLWASFTALVNQQRLATGHAPLGFANPPIYAIGQGSSFGRDFHDIADNSTNLFYPAVAGYDDATGWGSFRGAALLADLSGATLPTPLTAPFTLPAGLSLFSLPDTYGGDALNTLFGGVYPYYVWSQANGRYNSPTSPPAQPGQGYWVVLPQAVTVTQSGQAVTDTAPRSVALSAGWNQIGDPFASQVAIANLQVTAGGQLYSFEQASGSASLVSGVLYRYDNAAGQYAPVDEKGVLTPGAGYWLYARLALTLGIPPP